MLQYDIIQLKASTAGRPKGYVEFVLKHGKIEGGFIFVNETVQKELSQQFPPEKFEIAKLKANTEQFPMGFADFILSRGKKLGRFVELDLATLDELHEKFPIPTFKVHINGSIKKIKTPNQKPAHIAARIRSLHQSTEAIDDETVDQLFGIEYDEIEDSIPIYKYEKSICRKWPKQNTQSSFEKIRRTYANLALGDGATVYDLGCGHGRVLLYGASLFPQIRFKGVELVSERVKAIQQAARNAKLTNVELINENVLNVDLSDGTVFYFFNPFPAIMKIILHRLYQVALKTKIAIVTSGRTTRDVACIPWLKVIKKFGQSDRALAIHESEISLQAGHKPVLESFEL